MKWVAGKLYCNTVIVLQLRSVGLARLVLQYKYCVAGWEAGLAECIAIHWTVLWLEGLQKAGLYRNTT